MSDENAGKGGSYIKPKGGGGRKLVGRTEEAPRGVLAAETRQRIGKETLGLNNGETPKGKAEPASGGAAGKKE